MVRVSWKTQGPWQPSLEQKSEDLSGTGRTDTCRLFFSRVKADSIRAKVHCFTKPHMGVHVTILRPKISGCVYSTGTVADNAPVPIPSAFPLRVHSRRLIDGVPRSRIKYSRGGQKQSRSFRTSVPTPKVFHRTLKLRRPCCVPLFRGTVPFAGGVQTLGNAAQASWHKTSFSEIGAIRK